MGVAPFTSSVGTASSDKNVGKWYMIEQERFCRSCFSQHKAPRF